ncbi:MULTISPECIES: threonine/serine dehydratase [unclassified Amycolatopsis]|uniref:threonine/serine dehydratase n=1 Tax=unclassified Amycolatopsis TaxID=2618356 RepID=UPI0028740C07|nr:MULTISPECIES: threonine/serine dehydratase [unclassified Amycolatopsis]MDS0135696.1 threonine/serine dehydratase [Amycolatopsis sp. 505]MDS0148288.1 threonine/serine dehydratase [Amycolatopsis sp. CM201R]
MISTADVERAAARIEGRVRRTPVLAADEGVWFKLEHLQHTGSFKARGAFNRIIAAGEQNGVVAASGGNAGLAVAYAASEFGLPARVYVPATAPAVKVAKLRQLGATVELAGEKYADAYDAAVKHAADSGELFCHAYDQPDICAGQGTLGLELLEQAGDLDTILVAVGGGGLLAGVAAAVEGRARVVGVEPRTIPTLHSALAAGEPVAVDVAGIAADSLGATRLGDIAFAVATRTNAGSVLVEDTAIAEARAALWDRYRLAVEPGGATAFAALLSGAYRPSPGERVAVLLCGANTDPATLTSPKAAPPPGRTPRGTRR